MTLLLPWQQDGISLFAMIYKTFRSNNHSKDSITWAQTSSVNRKGLVCQYPDISVNGKFTNYNNIATSSKEAEIAINIRKCSSSFLWQVINRLRKMRGFFFLKESLRESKKIPQVFWINIHETVRHFPSLVPAATILSIIVHRYFQIQIDILESRSSALRWQYKSNIYFIIWLLPKPVGRTRNIAKELKLILLWF